MIISISKYVNPPLFANDVRGKGAGENYKGYEEGNRGGLVMPESKKGRGWVGLHSASYPLLGPITEIPDLWEVHTSLPVLQ